MRFSTFEGPGKTFFVFEEADRLRIIDDSGEAALIPFPDFLGFLGHLAAHAAALELPLEARGWLFRNFRRGGSPPRETSPIVPPVAIGDCLFLFEDDFLWVQGRDGSEARVPLHDLSDLLEHLARSGDATAGGIATS
jgi:hypothetical protein